MIVWLERVNAFVWGIPALFLILGVGIYFTVRTGFLQIRLLPRALREFFKSISRKDAAGAISPYRAVCTALAATVGTGNLAGVAGAICIGGPGAVFWMWICGVLGMMLKFAEATLAVTIRKKNTSGQWIGGPMYMIRDGLGGRWKFLASIYCFFGVVAAFGVGNATQINTVIESIDGVFRSQGIITTRNENFLMGICMAVVIYLMLSGGAKRIGAAAEKLVPFASVLYLILCGGVLAFRFRLIPDAFSQIIKGAFSPQAVTGGTIGSAFLALRIGAARGVFTNEAGMGTASIAHAGAEVYHPVAQGMMGIVEVFLDTIVICTVTALVILCSGVSISYGYDAGITLTAAAFANIYGQWIHVLLAFTLCCFALATVLGWGLYGGTCAQYLFGEAAWRPFVLLQGIFVVVGSVMHNDVLWMVSETVNGLMAIPNLIALFLLAPVLMKQINSYKNMGTRR